MQVDLNNQRQPFARVLVMPRVSHRVLTEFLGDLKNSESR